MRSPTRREPFDRIIPAAAFTVSDIARISVIDGVVSAPAVNNLCDWFLHGFESAIWRSERAESFANRAIVVRMGGRRY